MGKFINRSEIKTAEDVKSARDELSKIASEIKKGVEPVANAGAGKAEEPKTPVKAKKVPAAVKKSDAPSAPVKGKKAAAKPAAVEEEETKPADKPAEEDAKRKIVFGAKDSHTKILRDAYGDDKKGFENAKKAINKIYETLSREEQDAKTYDEHVQTWLDARNQPKAAEPVNPTVLSYEELKGLAGLTEQPNMAGIYWHADTGRHVTGPVETSDEEDVIKTMGEIDYQVGETTKRVYDVETEKFLGFAGIGEFKDL